HLASAPHLHAGVTEMQRRDTAHPRIAGVVDGDKTPGVVFVREVLLLLATVQRRHLRIEAGNAANILDRHVADALIIKLQYRTAAPFRFDRAGDRSIEGEPIALDRGHDAFEIQIERTPRPYRSAIRTRRQMVHLQLADPGIVAHAAHDHAVALRKRAASR